MRLRTATTDDIPTLRTVIRESVRGLARDWYDERQIELSINSVFGVDTDLIEDGTYFVAEIDGEIAGCGGWSKRKTLYGASAYTASREPDFLDPATDAAKIRAFFVHPRAARKGIGSLILERCEDEAKRCGFSKAEMMATLPGVPLYLAKGYSGDEEVDVAVGEGVSIRCIRMAKSLVQSDRDHRANEDIRLEAAELSDLARLSEIAFAAKAYWQYPAEWLARWRPQLTISESDLSSGTAVKLTKNGEIRGFYLLREDDEKLWLEHLWVEPDGIGHGFGRSLFEHAMTTAGELGHSRVLIESDPNAEGFYAAMGAKRFGEHRTELDGNLRILPLMEFKLKGS